MGPLTSHEIDYTIHGADMQYVEVVLDPGEAVVAEAGAMMYMDEGIQMDTRIGDGSKQHSGMLGSLLGAGKRMLAGEGAFVTFFTNHATQRRTVAFSTSHPGEIIPLDLRELGGSILCQKHAFICGAKGVALSVGFTKRIATGFFGGEGFVLQRLRGDGLVFVHAGGSVQRKELAPGQVVYVDTGSLVAFTESVDFNISVVKGVGSMLFGGEQLFLTKMVGPGSVWIQSMPFPRLMAHITYEMLERLQKQKR